MKRYGKEYILIEFTKKQREDYEKGIQVLQNILYKMEWNLQEEHGRGFVDGITARVKTPQSIEEKLIRKGFGVSMETAIKRLNDMGGVRCVCPYIDDVYMIADLLREQKQIRIIKTKNFIKKPKKTGYRSLHFIIEVPIPTQEGGTFVKIELQIRTLIMNLWARLDHRKLYKKETPEHVKTRKMLLACSKLGAALDKNIMKIRHATEKMDLT